MDIPLWIWNVRKRRRADPRAKIRELRLNKHNGINFASVSYQKKAWRRMHKSIIFYMTTLNQNNVKLIWPKLLKNVNLVRGKGLLCYTIMELQLKNLESTGMYADLMSFINYEFPNIGELLLTRCILQFKKAYHQSNKYVPAATIIFIAHLIKRNIASEVLALDLIRFLGTSWSDYSIYLTCEILNICGIRLVNGRHENEIISIFFRMLHFMFFNRIHKRITIMIYKVLKQFQNKFKDQEEIDLVPLNTQLTHSIDFHLTIDPRDDLNYFARDIDYEANEKLHFQLVYKKIPKYEVKYCNDSYNSDGDADNEDDGEEEIYKDIFV